MLPTEQMKHTGIKRGRDRQQARACRFLPKKGYAVSNTFFKKPDKHKVTYSSQKPYEFKPSWIENKHAEIDLFLTKQEWRNTITDVKSRTSTAINSDHAIVTADF